jgi:tRNA (guanine-N7-)-methyltransferase
MARKKLHKYGQVSSSERVQEVAFRQTAKYKGQWSENFFGNQNPLVIELACGYGEYAVGLANEYPNKNYLGIDIKGDRLWKGLQDAQEIGLENVGFVRSDIFWLENIFAVGEIDEIWIIHPDPRPKREKQRLTHPSIFRNVLWTSQTKREDVSQDR